MPPDDTAELLAVVRSFVAAELEPRLDQVASSDRLDPTLLTRLVAGGLWSIGLPESVGGQGADVATALLVIRELAAASPSLAVALVHTHAVGHVLVAAGRHDEARRVAGGEVWVLAWGSTVEGQLRLPRVDLGLQPNQVVAVDAEGAMVVWPATRLPAGPVLGRCGLPGLGPRSLALDETPVPGVDRGRVAAAWWRLGTAACALGTASGALARAKSYVETRRQFGAPLVQIPTIARTVRTIGRELDDASTAVLTEAGRAGDIPPDLARSVANTAVRGCLESVQLLGGYGYLTEYVVEGRLRDAVSLRAISRLAPS